jgi:hypothetical protein
MNCKMMVILPNLVGRISRSLYSLLLVERVQARVEVLSMICLDVTI